MGEDAAALGQLAEEIARGADARNEYVNALPLSRAARRLMERHRDVWGATLAADDAWRAEHGGGE